MERRQAGARRRLAGLLVGLAVVAAAGPGMPDEAAEVQATVEDAGLVHEAAFSYTCAADTWERILDHPVVLGALWQAYGFGPAYRVTSRGDTVHVVDPTGLVGDVVVCSRTPGGRVWLARGRLDHWAVPFFNDGEAVFAMESHSVGPRIEGRLTIHVRATSVVGRLVLRAGHGLLAAHVAHRVRANLADAGRIVAAIQEDPAAVAQRLEGREAAQFREIFVAAGGGRTP